MKWLVFILVCAWLFSWIDWQTVRLTRFEHPGWKAWMHAHERSYATVKGVVEFFLCAPAIPLKPLFYEAMVRIGTSPEQREAITHAPEMSFAGFYRPVVRGDSYSFIPWALWFLYWTPASLLWVYLTKRLLEQH